MGEAFLALADTPAGDHLAIALALLAAVAHAAFGAINKGGVDPWLNRGAINLAYGLIAAPFALFAFPLPDGRLWLILAGVYLIHLVYEAFQARAYEIGGFSIVYPLARGTSPILVALAAGALFGEGLGLLQWGGLALLSGGIYAFAWLNMREEGLDDPAARRQLRAAILTALATGGMVAAYTLYDAWGIRQAADPFTFLAWFFTLGGLGFPLVAAARWRRLAPAQHPPVARLAARGLVGALVAFVSFGAIMLAIRIGDVAEVAALRETSIVFAALIGAIAFGERLGRSRYGLIVIIVIGAAIVQAR